MGKCHPGLQRLPPSLSETCERGVLPQEPGVRSAHLTTCSSDTSLPVSSLFRRKHEMRGFPTLQLSGRTSFPALLKCLSRLHSQKMHVKGYSNMTQSDNGTFLVTGESNIFIFYCLKYLNLSFLLKRKKNIKKLKICRNLSRKFASYLLPLSTFLFWGRKSTLDKNHI